MVMSDESREILQALAGVQQQLRHLQSDLRVASAATEQHINSIQDEIASLRADLAGALSASRDNKKKSSASPSTLASSISAWKNSPAR